MTIFFPYIVSKLDPFINEPMLPTKLIKQWDPPNLTTIPSDFDETITTGAVIKRDWSSATIGVLISNFCDSSFTNNNVEYTQGISPGFGSMIGSIFNYLIGIIKDC